MAAIDAHKKSMKEVLRSVFRLLWLLFPLCAGGLNFFDIAVGLLIFICFPYAL